VYYKMKAILLFALSAIILSQSYGFAYAAMEATIIQVEAVAPEQ